MPVPFIDLKRFEENLIPAWLEKVEEITRETRFVGGPDVIAFEETLCKDNSVAHAIGCANGTDALQLALRGVGVGPGDVVLLPDATFWATFEAIINVGAKPVCVDISEADLQMDYDLFVEAAAKHKPKAAMLVHLYGWGSARLADFRAFCRAQGIALIEDGAQAYGVRYKGESIYKGAQIATISFYPAKTFGAAGDAGAVLTSDPALAERVRSLGNHGREQHYAHGSVGWNSRLSGFQAAWLQLSFPHLPARLESRRHFAKRYREDLASRKVRTVAAPADYVENGYLNVTLHEPEFRDRLKALLTERKIGSGIVYPGAVSEQKGAEGLVHDTFSNGHAQRLGQTVLNLPLFPYMREDEYLEVLAAIDAL